jgi:hypothetical protein
MGVYKSVLELIIDTKAAPGNQVQLVQDRLVKAGKMGEAAGQKAKAAWKSALGPIVAITAAVYAMNKAFEFAVQGERLQNLRAAFEQLDETGGASLRAISKGMNDVLPEAQARQFAIKMRGMNASVEQLGQVAELSFKIAAAQGLEVTQVIERMSMAVISGRIANVDQFGIIVKGEEVYDRYAKKIGVASNALNEQQRQAAKAQAIISEGLRIYDSVDTTLLQTDLQKLAAQYEDLKAEAQEAAAGVVLGTINMAKGVFAPMAYARELREAATATLDLSKSTRELTINGKTLAETEEILATRARARKFLLDAEGKVLGERLHSVEAYRTALVDIASLEAIEAKGLVKLTGEQKEQVKALKLGAAEYASLNTERAKDAAIMHAADLATRKQTLSVKDLGQVLADAKELVEGYQDAQDEKEIKEYAKEHERLLPLFKQLDSELTVSTNAFRQLAAGMAQAGGQLRKLQAQAAQRKKLDDGLKSTVEGTRAEIDAILTIHSDLDTAVGRVESTLAKVASGTMGMAEGVAEVSGNLLMLNDLLIASGEEPAFLSEYDARKEALRLIKEEKAAQVNLVRFKSTTAKKAVEDLTRAELARQKAILTSTDAVFKIEESAAVSRDALAEELHAKGIGRNAAELALARINLDERAALAELEADKERDRLGRMEELRRAFAERNKSRVVELERLEREAAETRARQFDNLRDDLQYTSAVFSDNLRAMKDIGWEFSENISMASNAATDAALHLVDAIELGADAYGRAVPGAINASGKFAAAFIKNERARAYVRALFETGASVAAFATGNMKGGVMHAMSAALFMVAAGKAGSGDAASGSGAGTGGGGLGFAGGAVGTGLPERAPMGGGGTTNQTVVIKVDGFGTKDELGEEVVKVANRVAGYMAFDGRLISKPALVLGV